jgi:predicted DNA-binding transcriptional regulator AlpA
MERSGLQPPAFCLCGLGVSIVLHDVTTSGRDATLIDVDAVAAMLDCSSRTVRRMSDSGLMPPPVRLSALVRWRRTELEAWIADGCQPCRQIRRVTR